MKILESTYFFVIFPQVHHLFAAMSSPEKKPKTQEDEEANKGETIPIGGVTTMVHLKVLGEVRGKKKELLNEY